MDSSAAVLPRRLAPQRRDGERALVEYAFVAGVHPARPRLPIARRRPVMLPATVLHRKTFRGGLNASTEHHRDRDQPAHHSPSACNRAIIHLTASSATSLGPPSFDLLRAAAWQTSRTSVSALRTMAICAASRSTLSTAATSASWPRAVCR